MSESKDFIRPYSTLIRSVLIGSLALPFVSFACTLCRIDPTRSIGLLIFTAVVIVSLLLFWISGEPAEKLVAWLDAESEEQSKSIDGLKTNHLFAAIVLSAGVGLFLELAVLRWQATVFQFFAFYKNFSLLACFAGLGLGYAVSNRRQIPVIATIPLLTWQFVTFLVQRYGVAWWSWHSLNATPITEQLNMGTFVATSIFDHIAIYYFLALTFLTTSLIFVPLGQLAGRCMDRYGDALGAYSGNLLGSLLGVLAIVGLSFFWTPPIIWFCVGFAALVPFMAGRPKALLLSCCAALLAIIALAWPVHFLREVVYSPYQILERGAEVAFSKQHPDRDPGANELGINCIRAAGTYYQRIEDLSLAWQKAEPSTAAAARHYGLPYQFRPNPESVAIVGTGTGNDVAAALRANPKAVSAIEIDPAIMAIGARYHPERPYQDLRVTPIINDARNFFRNTKSSFDVIVFGLLDSHIQSSQMSSLRIDSYVYTLESIKEARARLKPGGLLCLSFADLHESLKKKLFLMMTSAFDGREPVVLTCGYDDTNFIQNKEGTFDISRMTVPAGVENITNKLRQLDTQVDVSTDDWPFLYIARRIYPVSYLPMILLVLLETVFLIHFLSGERPQSQYLSFFFLGAGFMLIETKAITELSLTWGNTWYVIAIVISAILLMAYFANLIVRKVKLRSPLFPLAGLIFALLLGLWVVSSSVFDNSFGGKIMTTAAMTLPILFSGLLFSTLLSECESVPGAMGMNLLGAMLGGVLEYNATYFGYQALYLIAIVVYVCAWLSTFKRSAAPAT
jgi:SAM-dependent methyltransferase